MKKIITNEELQIGLSEALGELKLKNRDNEKLRIHAVLAGKLLSSVKMDMLFADKTGQIFSRTKTFMGVE